MKSVLVIYGTTDGQTARIAAFAGEVIRGLGCMAYLRNANEAGVTASEFDAALVLASLHSGGYQRSVGRWVRRNATALAERPNAFFPVCLAVLERRPETRHDLDRILEKHLAQWSWRPRLVRYVAGALPYTRYGWLKRWLMSRRMAASGHDADTTRDFEYTDWDAVRAHCISFLEQLKPAVSRPGSNRCCVTCP